MTNLTNIVVSREWLNARTKDLFFADKYPTIVEIDALVDYAKTLLLHYFSEDKETPDVGVAIISNHCVYRKLFKDPYIFTDKKIAEVRISANHYDEQTADWLVTIKLVNSVTSHLSKCRLNKKMADTYVELVSTLVTDTLVKRTSDYALS